MFRCFLSLLFLNLDIMHQSKSIDSVSNSCFLPRMHINCCVKLVVLLINYRTVVWYVLGGWLAPHRTLKRDGSKSFSFSFSLLAEIRRRLDYFVSTWNWNWNWNRNTISKLRYHFAIWKDFVDLIGAALRTFTGTC